MNPEICDRVMLEISVAHDEGRPLSPEMARHVTGCPDCSDFAARLPRIDQLLAVEDYSRVPDLTPGVIAHVRKPQRQWWSVAAIALVGLVVGALVGGVGTTWDTGAARDLGSAFHTAGTHLQGLSADLLVVERGVHPDVPERVYSGSIDYVAPERLAIQLLDTTDYPGPGWKPNDVTLTISDGEVLTVAGSPCPIAAMPDCLVQPSARALRGQPPFDEGVLRPLEIVGPGRGLTWPSGFDVMGTTDLHGVSAIQVRSTVAAMELIGAITDLGAWRELHPTDQVLMWLDESTLVPLRVEVFTSDSPERELWQLRHGYDDDPEDEAPIFILELSGLVTEPGVVEIDLPSGAPSRGFVDEEVDLPTPDLPDGFQAHRSGHWHLADGGRVDVASWSDGRSWIKVEVTTAWDEPRFFGVSLPFVSPIALRQGSVGYLSPDGGHLAIHGEGTDVLVSGSVSQEVLVEAAASLGVPGLGVPAQWEASTTGIEALPAGTLVPSVKGWSVLARSEGETTTILLTGGGARDVVITQSPGSRLDPPVGPDYSEVSVRGIDGRYNASATTLEWVEHGHILRMKSETVALSELIDLASTMEPR